MSRRYYSNTATQATLASGITSGATSLTINETFAGWPATPFDAVLEYGTANAEVVIVTNISGKTATIGRGQDGTSAVSHNAGATLDHSVIARDLDEPNAHINASASVHGILGNVVGDSDTQTLTNKIISGATINGTTALAGTVNLSGTISGGTVSGATLSGGTISGTVQTPAPVLTNNDTLTLIIKNTGTSAGDVTLKLVPANAGAGTSYSIAARDNVDGSTVFSVDNGGGVNATFFQATNGIILPAWSSYTPTLTATGVNPTNWTCLGKYQSFGSTILYEITMQPTAGFTTGTGDYIVTLPPFAAAQSSITPVGQCVVLSNSYTYVPTLITNGSIKLAVPGNSTGYLGDGGPYGHAWSQGNVVRISGMYRVN